MSRLAWGVLGAALSTAALAIVLLLSSPLRRRLGSEAEQLSGAIKGWAGGANAHGDTGAESLPLTALDDQVTPTESPVGGPPIALQGASDGPLYGPYMALIWPFWRPFWRPF